MLRGNSTAPRPAAGRKDDEAEADDGLEVGDGEEGGVVRLPDGGRTRAALGTLGWGRCGPWAPREDRIQVVVLRLLFSSCCFHHRVFFFPLPLISRLWWRMWAVAGWHQQSIPQAPITRGGGQGKNFGRNSKKFNQKKQRACRRCDEAPIACIPPLFPSLALACRTTAGRRHLPSRFSRQRAARAGSFVHRPGVG